MNRLSNGLKRVLVYLSGRDPDFLQHSSNTVAPQAVVRGLLMIGIYLVFFAAWAKLTGWWFAGLVIASLIVIFDVILIADIEYRNRSGQGGKLPSRMNHVRVLAAVLLGVCMGYGVVIDQNQETLDRETVRRWSLEAQPLFDAREVRREHQRDGLHQQMQAVEKSLQGDALNASVAAATDQFSRSQSLFILILDGGVPGLFLLLQFVLIASFYVVLETLLLGSAGIGRPDFP